MKIYDSSGKQGEPWCGKGCLRALGERKSSHGSALKSCVCTHGQVELWSIKCEPGLLSGASGMALPCGAVVLSG